MKTSRAFKPCLSDCLERREAPSITVGTFPFHLNAPPPLKGPYATYLSHPNRLSTDPLVRSGVVDFVFNSQYMVGNAMRPR
jgi:hypothetical protein